MLNTILTSSHHFLGEWHEARRCLHAANDLMSRSRMKNRWGNSILGTGLPSGVCQILDNSSQLADIERRHPLPLHHFTTRLSLIVEIGADVELTALST